MTPRLHPSTAFANQRNDFIRGRQPASLLFRIDFLSVNENVQRAWPAQADASRNLQLAFDVLFQAHGLRLDVVSKETALDFDVHSGLLKILPRTSTNRGHRERRGIRAAAATARGRIGDETMQDRGNPSADCAQKPKSLAV